MVDGGGRVRLEWTNLARFRGGSQGVAQSEATPYGCAAHGSRHCCLLFVLTLGPSVVAADDREANAYVDRFAAYLQAARNVSFDFEYTTYEVGGGIGPTEKLIRFARGSQAVRKDEFRLRRRQRYRIWRAGLFKRGDLDSEEIVTDQRRVHIQASYPIDGDEFDVMSLPSEGESPVVVTWESPPHIEVGYLDPVSNTLHGILSDDSGRYVVDIMRSDGRNEVSDELVDGVPVKRLTSTSTYGRYSVWLDPAAGDAPRRIELRKGADDLFNGVPLSSYRLNDPQDRHPNAAMREYRFDVDKVLLTSVSGSDRFAMSNFEVRITQLYNDGESFVQRHDVSLATFRYECTDADLRPTMAIPDKTRVHIQDAPMLQAEWVNDEVVKVVNQDVLRQFEGSANSGVAPRHWLLALNVAAAVVLGLYFLWRRRLRRTAT